MALVRSNDTERFQPSMTVSLDGVCGSSNGSGMLSAPVATPTPTVDDDDKGGHDTPAGAPHWGYLGDQGPANWGTLHADWKICASGIKQSPVNINVGNAETSGEASIVANAGSVDNIRLPTRCFWPKTSLISRRCYHEISTRIGSK